MSDTTRPEGNTYQERSADAEPTIVPHSGDLGLEKPVTEFDNTSLETAATQGLLETPDHPGVLVDADEQQDLDGPESASPTTKKNRNKLALFVGGGVFALLAAGAGFLAGRDTGTEQLPTSAPGEEIIEEDVAEPEVATTTPIDTEVTVGPNNDGGFGTISLAETLRADEDYITAVRPSGDEIQVPRLRDTSDLNAFGQSALALIACYMTTGSQECLDEFSLNEETQASLEQIRQQVMITPYEGLTGIPSYPYFQMVVYDEGTNPTEFARSSEPGFIKAEGGPIYFQVSDDIEWQGLESTNNWFGQIAHQVEFRVEDNPDGSVDIIGMRLNMDTIG